MAGHERSSGGAQIPTQLCSENALKAVSKRTEGTTGLICALLCLELQHLPRFSSTRGVRNCPNAVKSVPRDRVSQWVPLLGWLSSVIPVQDAAYAEHCMGLGLQTRCSGCAGYDGERIFHPSGALPKALKPRSSDMGQPMDSVTNSERPQVRAEPQSKQLYVQTHSCGSCRGAVLMQQPMAQSFALTHCVCQAVIKQKAKPKGWGGMCAARSRAGGLRFGICPCSKRVLLLLAPAGSVGWARGINCSSKGCSSLHMASPWHL